MTRELWWCVVACFVWVTGIVAAAWVWNPTLLNY